MDVSNMLELIALPLLCVILPSAVAFYFSAPTDASSDL